jgi:hypothetical protein
VKLTDNNDYYMIISIGDFEIKFDQKIPTKKGKMLFRKKNRYESQLSTQALSPLMISLIPSSLPITD